MAAAALDLEGCGAWVAGGAVYPDFMTFSDALERVLNGRPSLLVIDLMGITFLASVGLGVLGALAGGGESAIRIKVVATGRATARPIQLTGLDQVIDLYSSREDALAGG